MLETKDANELKQKGNQAFKEHDWPNAVRFYTEAIEANDKDPSFYANRAQVDILSPRSITETKAYLWRSRQTSNSKHTVTLLQMPQKPSNLTVRMLR